ncbi:MAG TPA: HEAT repeat domain-containing protein, partial [Actinomycetota bacterium]|nr:HEAT repeat domain-containing protein [Actinomycetota bacterium]
VRRACCEFLDHYLVPEALPELIRLVDDPHPRVRLLALHALACDRCKEGDCRAEEEAVLPKAVRVLRQDPSPHTRAMAIEVIGRFVHASDVASLAVVEAATSDPSSAVRKKASWHAPGGTIYTRTAPRPPRATKSTT